jgi:hypothetical protein
MILLLLMLVSLAVHAQTQKASLPRDTLAMVDSWAITTQDLFERLELMPTELKLEEHDFEAVKRKAVQSLVGERILSLARGSSNDPDDWRSKNIRNVLEKMFVRDALYKQEIRDQVSISASELREAIFRMSCKRRILGVRFPSFFEAARFATEWKRRRSDHESNSSIFLAYNVQPDTILIAFSSVDSVLEDIAYRLKDTTDVSPALHSSLFGAMVATLFRVEPDLNIQKLSREDREKNAREVLQRQKETSRASAFVDGVLRGKQMEADSILFRSVSRSLWERLRLDTVARRVPGGFRYLPEDVYGLLSEFKSNLDSPIVRGSFGVLRLGDFLEYLFHYDFSIPSVRPRSFAVSLFQILRAMTEGDLIAQEGLRRGFQYRAEIQRDVSVWMNYWESRFNEFDVTDTVTFRAWEPYWSLWRNNGALVESTCVQRVQEILRPDSTSTAELLRSIGGGASMDSLAQLYTVRTEWRAKGGMSGWFTFRERHELSSKLIIMEEGETRGPIKLREGYAILRLIGRKFNVGQPILDSLLQREVSRVRILHQQAAVNRFVAQEAIHHNVEIYYERIGKADVTNVNIFTRRSIGFGGRINAAPILVPQWQWVDEWKRMRQLAQ